MILQALVDYYEVLAEEGKIARPGWADTGVSYALFLGDDGELSQVVPLKIERDDGKRKTLVPQAMRLPAPVKRTTRPLPNFLWDNSSYILGIDQKNNPKRSLECFSTCRELHKKILSAVDSPAARALLAFFEHWEPETAREHPLLANRLDDMFGGNLVFSYDGRYLHEDLEICKAWDTYYSSAGEGPEMVCLVTGKRGPVEAVHPAIKGVVGAQSSGAALVSFNAPAFCSYGRDQNLNAPTSKYAAFAYTSALNYLLKDRERLFRLGDVTVLFWAKNGKSAYQNLFVGFLLGASDLAKIVEDLLNGDAVSFDDAKLDPNMDFYILGLAPNAARLSVQFFLHNTFGSFLQNVQTHYSRLEITRPAFDKFETIPLWKLLEETVNQKSPSKKFATEMTWAVLNNIPYPATLLNSVVLRIRAERNITRSQAAILKAYYTKSPHSEVPAEEVLTVSLNPNSTNVPYNLGRLFSVLEAIQSAANPSINTTIKDRYFNSASATPSYIFPLLIRLAQKHLRKLNEGLRIYYEKQLKELQEKLGETYPDRMSLPQQGSFQLGYYHQRYHKKEETKND